MTQSANELFSYRLASNASNHQGVTDDVTYWSRVLEYEKSELPVRSAERPKLLAMLQRDIGYAALRLEKALAENPQPAVTAVEPLQVITALPGLPESA